ncbi:MAG: hypothetical protein HQK49_09470 [Oligoflexia bacterium]|nr:hypothetical protein [Oligoflexia bacterium]
MIIEICKNRNFKAKYVFSFTNVMSILILPLISILITITTTTNASYAGLFFDSPRTKLFKIISTGDDGDNKFESILKTILDKKNKKGVFRINQKKSSIRNSWNNKTLLSYAVEMKRPKIVQMLLNNGADPDILHKEKHSLYYPIDLAIKNCDYDILKILIKYAKKIDHTNNLVHITSDANNCGKEFADLFIEKYSENSIKGIIDNKIASKLEPSLLNRFIQKLVEKNKFTTHEEFFELTDKNLNLNSINQETFNLISDWFYKLSPKKEDVIRFIIKFTSDNAINDKKTLLDAFEYFYTKPTSPIFENVQKLLSLASLKNKEFIRNIVIQKNIAQNPQNIIDLYSDNSSSNSTKSEKLKISENAIEKFLNFKPTPIQILNLVSLVSPSQNEEIMKKVIQKKIITGPENFIFKDTNNDTNNKKQIFSATFLDWFFSFSNPYPTLKQVMELISMSADGKQQNEIKNRTLNLNGGIILKKEGSFAQNFLTFYENKSDLILDDAMIAQFLSFNNPSPTIEQVLAFVRLAKPEQQTNIKRLAYNKFNLVKNPQDFVTLFSNINEISNPPANNDEQNLEDTIIESLGSWFFNSTPLPTLKQVLSLINLTRNNKQKKVIQDLAIKYGIVTEESIKMFDVLQTLKNNLDVEISTASNNFKKSNEYQKALEIQKATLSLLKEKNGEIKETGKTDTSECPICFGDETKLCNLSCSHKLCKNCAVNYFNLKLNARESLNCPNKGCQHLATWEEIKNIFQESVEGCNKEQELNNKYSKVLLDDLSILLSKLGYFHCPGNDCSMLFKKDINSGPQECEFCKTTSCHKCGEAHNHEVTCHDNQQLKSGDLFYRLVHDPYYFYRPCPTVNCGGVLSKADKACDQVVCSSCKQSVHLVRGKSNLNTDYTYTTYGEYANPRRYRVPGDINMITGKIYTTYTQLSDGNDDQIIDENHPYWNKLDKYLQNTMRQRKSTLESEIISGKTKLLGAGDPRNRLFEMKKDLVWDIEKK